METMKAVRMHSFGGPEVLVYEDVPKPQVREDDVLVRIHAAGVNPVDWKVREGYRKEVFEKMLPIIPGWDFSGVVEEVGSAATRLKVGDEVYGRPDTARPGTYAQYIAVRESETALKPKSIDHIHAAAIPLAALTAWQSIFDAAQLSAGQRILIHGAAGGVGTYAVQLAKWKGAYVIGTASERNHEFLRELGADEVIDYNKVRFEDVVKDVDVVLDTIAGETQERSWKVLKPGGILVSILSPPAEEVASRHNARGAFVFVQPNAGELKEIADLVDAGKVKAIIDAVFPLAEARKAQELSATGHVRGKIVLKVD